MSARAVRTRSRGQPAGQDVAERGERAGHADDPLEQQLLALPVRHRAYRDQLVEGTVEAAADRRCAPGEAGHRLLAQRHEEHRVLDAEDGLDVVEERLGAVAVADLVDLIDADDQASPLGLPPVRHPRGVAAEAVHQFRQRDRLLGSLPGGSAGEGQERFRHQRRRPARRVRTQVPELLQVAAAFGDERRPIGRYGLAEAAEQVNDEFPRLVVDGRGHHQPEVLSVVGGRLRTEELQNGALADAARAADSETAGMHVARRIAEPVHRLGHHQAQRIGCLNELGLEVLADGGVVQLAIAVVTLFRDERPEHLIPQDFRPVLVRIANGPHELPASPAPKGQPGRERERRDDEEPERQAEPGGGGGRRQEKRPGE